MLDKSVFVNSSILEDTFFNSIFNTSFGLPIIANSILLGFVLYYCFKLMLSPFSGTAIEKPYQFLAKLLIIIICINFSPFICKKILEINSLFTEALQELGSSICKQEISFNNLISKSAYVNTNDSFNIFSFNGLLKSFYSFGLINLLFSYSIRYIMIKIFILLSPFAILSLITVSTSWFFKSWLRTLLSLLFVQIFIVIILILLFALNLKTSDLFSQISYISTIFILTKANSYIKELIGGISTDINTNSINLKSLLK